MAMPFEGDRHRREYYKRLGAKVEPLVWQRLGMPDRSPFFFVWGMRSAPRTCDGSGSDFGQGTDCPEVRRIRKQWQKASTTAEFHVKYTLDDARKRFSEIVGDPTSEENDELLSVNRTALFDRSKRESESGRYPDPIEVPFLTMSIRDFGPTKVALGDLATVINVRTQQRIHAIVGDGRQVIGVEPSLWLSQELDLTGDDQAVYLIHPDSGSGQGVIPTNSEIHRLGERSFHRTPTNSKLAWNAILDDCFQDIWGVIPACDWLVSLRDSRDR